MKKIIFCFIGVFLSIHSGAQNIEIFELQKRCSVEADKYLQRRKDEILSPSKDAVHTITNHYNKKNGWCLMRSQYIVIGLKDFKGISIYNVLENKSVSGFQSLTNDITKKYWVSYCKLSDGNQCSSEEEYERDAQKLMNE